MNFLLSMSLQFRFFVDFKKNAFLLLKFKLIYYCDNEHSFSNFPIYEII